MKKLLLILLSFLAFNSVYSQNSYNVLVQANNIRVWAKTIESEVIPHGYLKFGEKVRLIGTQIAEMIKNSKPEYFVRIYRNGNNNVPYYLRLSEVNINLRMLQIQPMPDAIVEEEPINNLWMPLSNTLHKKGDILFFGGKSSDYIIQTDYFDKSYSKSVKGIYSFLDKASFKNSIEVDSEFTGFYKIQEIFKCKVNNEYKVFFDCQPLNTPFNENKQNEIYVDFYEESARNSIDFQTLNCTNDYFNLLLAYALSYYSGNIPDEFYESYLLTLYGNETISTWNEFKKNKIFSLGKSFMDSLYYNERIKTLNTPLSDVFYSKLSEYDFSNESYTVLFKKPVTVIFSPTNVNEIKLSLPLLRNLYESGMNLPIQGFINIPLFNAAIKMSADSAEKLLNETTSFPLSADRQVVLIVYYKFITAKKVKEFCEKNDIKDYTPDFHYFANFPKLIDSIEVYSGKGFTRDELEATPFFTISDKTKLRKWGTLYPQNNTKTSLDTR